MAYPNIITESSLPVSLAEFDHLPDSALIDVRVYAGLLSCSPNTIWRRAKAETLPSPIRISPQQTRWRVGDVRAALAALSAGGSAA